MDLIEQLLCPQVCMDVEDTPLEIEAPKEEPDISPEADLSTLPIELRTRLILENEFTFLPEQIPHQLLPSEEDIVSAENFSKVDYLKQAKLHCTVCTKHIGTALVEQLDRYIHPELNTLMCHNCFKFYGSGEFEKDEDGSEIYCKWCGQGGSVVCCSDCPLVFCSSCIRKNLGVIKVSQIKNSDNWRCFKCDPEQLSKFHVTCYVLHEYSTQQIKAAVATRNLFLVKDDFSTCCKRKRRKSPDSDDENDEFLPIKKSTKSKPKPTTPVNRDIIKAPGTGILKRALNTLNSEANVAQNNLFQSLQLQTAFPSPQINQPILKFHVSPVSQNNIPDPNFPSLAQLMPSLFNSMAVDSPNQNVINVAQPLRIQQFQPIRTTEMHVVNPKPNMKTAWLVNTVGVAKVQAQALIREAEGVQKSIQSAQNYADLANLHNKLQRAMAACTNKLIQTRKLMHKEFLKYLKSNHVSHTSVSNPTAAALSKPGFTMVPEPVQARHTKAFNPNANNKSQKKPGIIKRSNAKNTSLVTAAIDLCDDDDVCLIDDDDNIEESLVLSDDDAMVSNPISYKPDVPKTTSNRSFTPVMDLTEDIPTSLGLTPVHPPVNSLVVPNVVKQTLKMRIEANSKISFDSSELTQKEFTRAISVKVVLSDEFLTEAEKSMLLTGKTSVDKKISPETITNVAESSSAAEEKNINLDKTKDLTSSKTEDSTSLNATLPETKTMPSTSTEIRPDETKSMTDTELKATTGSETKLLTDADKNETTPGETKSTASELKSTTEQDECSTGFDFVREMQNEIESISASPPLMPEEETSTASFSNVTNSAPSPKNTDESIPAIDVALEAIKQLTESIAESQLSKDFDSGDQAQNNPSVTSDEICEEKGTSSKESIELQEKTSLENENTASESHKVNNFEQDSVIGMPILNVTPPAICLEDIVKIYDTAESSIDGDMVPTD